MRRPVKLTLRLVAIVGAAVLIAAVVSSSPGPASSPYTSSLSGLTFGPVYAASTCGNTGCNRLGHCSRLRGYNCQYSGGECQQTPC